MEGKQLMLWKKEYYDSFIAEGKFEKKSLTARVEMNYKFNSLRKPLDFNVLSGLVENRYSSFKLPKMLINSVSNYQSKKPEDVDFVDLFHMYCSINSVFNGEVNKANIKKWSRANLPLTDFGICQYELMEKYIFSLG